MQFLVEAIVLSLFGGLLGIGMGYALSAAAERFLQWPTSIPANAIGMAFGFAAATGVFFGFYPAKKAAEPRSDRSAALRVSARGPTSSRKLSPPQGRPAFTIHDLTPWPAASPRGNSRPRTPPERVSGSES